MAHFYNEYATQYGVNEAIMINHMVYWISKNRVQNKNYQDGKTWMYCTLDEFGEAFPFFSKSTIRTTIKSLESQGIIIKTAKYNSNKYIKTNWYAFVDEETFLTCAKTDTPMCHQPQREKTHSMCEESPTNIKDNNLKNNKAAVDAFCDSYNSICTGIFNKIDKTALTKKQTEHINRAMKFLENNRITDYWKRCISDNFLTGKKNPKFKATFDYLLQIDTIQRTTALSTQPLEDIMDEIIASVVNIFCITRGDVKPNEITQLVGLFEKTRQREIPDAQVVSYFYKSDLSLISTIHQFSFDMIS